MPNTITVPCGACSQPLTLPVNVYNSRIKTNKSGKVFHTHCGLGPKHHGREIKNSDVTVQCNRCGCNFKTTVQHSMGKLSTKHQFLCNTCRKNPVPKYRFKKCSWCEEVATYNAGYNKNDNRLSCNAHKPLLVAYMMDYVEHNLDKIIDFVPEDN